jgi:hypothetical protein
MGRVYLSYVCSLYIGETHTYTPTIETILMIIVSRGTLAYPLTNLAEGKEKGRAYAVLFPYIGSKQHRPGLPCHKYYIFL